MLRMITGDIEIKPIQILIFKSMFIRWVYEFWFWSFLVIMHWIFAQV